MSTQGVSQAEGAASAAPSPSNGPGLDLVGLTKVFPGGTVAVEDVNLHVDHGEYVVLLGPSGCGKTTTLRMIGGHEFPSEGDILLDGQSLVGLPPHKRPTTTVFQHSRCSRTRACSTTSSSASRCTGCRRSSGASRRSTRWRWSA